MKDCHKKRTALKAGVLQDRKVYCSQARPCTIQPGNPLQAAAVKGLRVVLPSDVKPAAFRRRSLPWRRSPHFVVQLEPSVTRQRQAVLFAVHVVGLPGRPGVRPLVERERAAILQNEVKQTSVGFSVPAYTHVFGCPWTENNQERRLDWFWIFNAQSRPTGILGRGRNHPTTS